MSLQSDRDSPQVGFDEPRARAAIGERNRIRQAASPFCQGTASEMKAYDQNRFEAVQHGGDGGIRTHEKWGEPV